MEVCSRSKIIEEWRLLKVQWDENWWIMVFWWSVKLWLWWICDIGLFWIMIMEKMNMVKDEKIWEWVLKTWLAVHDDDEWNLNKNEMEVKVVMEDDSWSSNCDPCDMFKSSNDWISKLVEDCVSLEWLVVRGSYEMKCKFGWNLCLYEIKYKFNLVYLRLHFCLLGTWLTWNCILFDFSLL